MSDSTPKGPCSICRGGYDEHFDENGKSKTMHVYTQVEGDLATPQQKQAQVRQQGGAVAIPMNMASMAAAGTSMNVGRLVEVLLEKNVMTSAEALYVAGMGPKPAPPSGFADPAMGGN